MCFFLPLDLPLQFGILLVLIFKNYFLSCKNQSRFLAAFCSPPSNTTFSFCCFLKSCFYFSIGLSNHYFSFQVLFKILHNIAFFFHCNRKQLFPMLYWQISCIVYLGELQFCWVLPSTASVCKFLNFSSNFILTKPGGFSLSSLV